MKKGWLILIFAIIILIVVGIVYCLYHKSPNSQNCAKEGETSYDDTTGQTKQCCSGLKEIQGLPDGTPDECKNFSEMIGFGTTCSNCGNNVCEKWENKCNCQVDCK